MDHFVPSLLDRLLPDGASDGTGRAAAPRYDLAQVKQSVARDIETLLNARPCFEPEQLSGFDHVAHSLLTFGLTDIASMSVASDADRHRIVEAIRRSLADHEPRLSEVAVTVHDEPRVGAGLCFSIRAALHLNPSMEPVAFDAVLHPGSNRYAVSQRQARGHAGT